MHCWYNDHITIVGVMIGFLWRSSAEGPRIISFLAGLREPESLGDVLYLQKLGVGKYAQTVMTGRTPGMEPYPKEKHSGKNQTSQK